MRDLRRLVREVLKTLYESSYEDDENKDEELLTEPDEPNPGEDEQKEVSGVSAIAGVTTPLGTGPAYPAGKKKKKKLPKGWQKAKSA